MIRKNSKKYILKPKSEKKNIIGKKLINLFTYTTDKNS